MSTFETIMAILNLIAVLLIPVIAVIVGQYLQERTQKRKDKMQISQCLMTRRATGWAGIEAVNALNSIDIIFADSSSVRGQWKILLEKSRPDITAQDYYLEQCKLLELMANDLGYKDKITWENIQKPYYPQGLDQQIAMNTQIMNGQVEWAKAVGLFSQQMVVPKEKPEGTNESNT